MSKYEEGRQESQRTWSIITWEQNTFKKKKTTQQKAPKLEGLTYKLLLEIEMHLASAFSILFLGKVQLGCNLFQANLLSQAIRLPMK